jgi:lysophospholipase L1-like esterase
VLALGDSLTANPTYCAGLRAQVSPQTTVVCKGYVGQGVAAVAAHLDEAWNAQATDVVILAGVNDLASGRSLTVIENALDGLYRQAEAAGLRVVAVTVCPWADHAKGQSNLLRTRELNRWIAGHPVPAALVDTSPLGDAQGRLLPAHDAGDGLHMTQAGAYALAALVAQEM